MGDDVQRGRDHTSSARGVQVIKLVHRRWPGLAATWGPIGSRFAWQANPLCPDSGTVIEISEGPCNPRRRLLWPTLIRL
jgi:hypothetical protein